MTVWRWPNYLTIDVPEAWSVQDSSDLIEIVPDESVGAVQISVLNRTRGAPLSAGEAELLLENFLAEQGGDDIRNRGVRREDASYVASASFRSLEDELTLSWDLVVYLWDDLALICTYCHNGEDEIRRAEARRMIATVRRDESAVGASEHVGVPPDLGR